MKDKTTIDALELQLKVMKAMAKKGKELRKYLVKCDLCKKTIKETDNIEESYQGGLCGACKELGGVPKK